MNLFIKLTIKEITSCKCVAIVITLINVNYEHSSVETKKRNVYMHDN